MASDLIYREDAKVFVRHACYKKFNPIDYLDEVPAADVVEVQHGRWEHNDDGYGCENLWWCSACKKEFVLIAGTPCDNGYYYCPNCGADMREVKDE